MKGIFRPGLVEALPIRFERWGYVLNNALQSIPSVYVAFWLNAVMINGLEIRLLLGVNRLYAASRMRMMVMRDTPCSRAI